MKAEIEAEKEERREPEGREKTEPEGGDGKPKAGLDPSDPDYKANAGGEAE